MSDQHIKRALEEFLSGQAILIDVREPEEWETSRIAGALPAPLSLLQDGELPNLPPSQKAYTYCRMGRRAQIALPALMKQYPSIEALCVDYDTLIKAGFPEESS